MSQIDTNGIDPELAGLIDESLANSIEIHVIADNYLSERRRITNAAGQASEFGAAIGSTNRENPQGGAVAGALLFGIFGQAAANAQIEQLNRKYEPEFQRLESRRRELEARQTSLADELTRRYGVQFRHITPPGMPQ